MFPAVRRIQRADPLPQFVVLQRRNTFKIPPRHGRQMYRSGIISDFLERRRKVKEERDRKAKDPAPELPAPTPGQEQPDQLPLDEPEPSK